MILHIDKGENKPITLFSSINAPPMVYRCKHPLYLVGMVYHRGTTSTLVDSQALPWLLVVPNSGGQPVQLDNTFSTNQFSFVRLYLPNEVYIPVNMTVTDIEIVWNSRFNFVTLFYRELVSV